MEHSLTRRAFVTSAAVLAALPPGLHARAQTVSAGTDNGFDWEPAPKSYKDAFVLGFVDGAMSCREQWKLATQSKLSAAKHNGFDTRSIHPSSLDEPFSYSNFTGIAPAQLVAGLDEFYKDFRNKRIHVRDAIQYVKDEIKGKPADKLQQNLEVYRKVAADRDYD